MPVETIFQRADISAPALINPADTTEKKKDFPKICVSTFSDNIIRKFASLENVHQIAELYTANGAMPVYKIRYKDTDIAFFQSRVGAPACVVGFEEIVAMGAERFVLFGSCGVLDDEKVQGKIIIPVSAVRDEGTSYHYAAPSPEIKADERYVDILERVLTECGCPYVKGRTWTTDGIYRGYVDILERVLTECGCPYVKGRTWTTDGIYRETLPVIQERKEQGCLAVEMECASMIAASQYRKIPFIQFLYGADSVGTDTWEIRDLLQYGLDSADKYMALAFECGLALM